MALKMAEQEKDSLSVYYQDSPNRPTLAVGGAYGGVAPDGSLVVAHIYVEHGTVPSLEEFEGDKEKGFDPSTGSKIKRGDLTREVQASLVMSPEVAVRLGQFLQRHGQSAIEARGPDE